jgi:hypothetical protein
MSESNIQQELVFIKKVMEDSRRLTINYGKYFIAPGVFITLGILLDYAAFKFKFLGIIPWIWIGVISFLWSYTFWNRWKDRKQRRVTTLASKFISSIWTGCSTAIFILISAGNISGALKAWSIQPVIALFLGVGFFVSGAVFNYLWLRLIAIGWWAGAVVLFLWPGDYAPLVLGLMMLLFYLLPSLILYYHWRREMATKSND